MLIIEWLLITYVKVIRGDNLPPHALKCTIGEILTSLTRMARFPYLVYLMTFFRGNQYLDEDVHARGLFSSLPSKDQHDHIAKISSICKSCVGIPDIDMNIIVLRVFSLTQTRETSIWFTVFPNNSTYTWEQYRDAFLPCYYSVSKKLKNKDRVNNFVTLQGQSLRNSWDRLTPFLRSIPNHHIYDEQMKEYFYHWKDDNNKDVLKMIAGDSYGECTYVEIAQKLEKFSRNNKSCRTRKSNTGRKTFCSSSFT